jgi:hypothetical protein
MNPTTAGLRGRRLLAGIGIALALCALSACTSPAETTSSSSAPSAKPDAPLAEKLAACIKDEGFEATVEWDGSVTAPEMPQAQSNKWGEVSTACAEKVGFYVTELTTAQKSQLYRQELAERECLAGLGKPTDEPPSEQQYIDTWGTADQYYAYYAAGGADFSQAEAKRLVADCPPPTWFIKLDGL